MSISRIISCVVLLAGCGGGDELGTSRAAIANGALDDHRGVIAVLATSTGQICSGVVVAPRVVLTARHCVATVENGPNVDCGRTRFGPIVDPGSVFVGTSSEGATPDQRHSVVRVLVDDDPAFCGHDVAALILARPLGGAPVVALRAEPVRKDETFSAIGFGRDGSAKSGTRRRRDGLRVECSGAECKNHQLAGGEWWGEGAVCEGDSGGPALDEEGRLMGIASRKRDGCSATVYLDATRATELTALAFDEAARTRESDNSAACTYGHDARTSPLALLLTLAAARLRRSRRSPRGCERMHGPSAPRRSV